MNLWASISEEKLAKALRNACIAQLLHLEHERLFSAHRPDPFLVLAKELKSRPDFSFDISKVT